MVADGVIKGVQFKRGGPVDKMLRKYYACQHNADILGMYISRMPGGEKAVELIERMIQTKYPFVNNAEAQRLDEVQKYNKGIAAAAKYVNHIKKKKDK